MSELKTYTTEQLEQKLAKHSRWLRGLKTGVRLDLSHADLREHGELLRGANLAGASLAGANLEDASLEDASLEGANLEEASLEGANLARSNLEEASLASASLAGANLEDASLEGANLAGANLSGATGLLDASRYLAEAFETTDEGIIVYKIFGAHYPPPSRWDIQPGAVIEETCNPCRTMGCGSGVNVATREWVMGEGRPRSVWRGLIRWIDLAGVVVPYNTDGKIRAARVELIESIEVVGGG